MCDLVINSTTSLEDALLVDVGFEREEPLIEIVKLSSCVTVGQQVSVEAKIRLSNLEERIVHPFGKDVRILDKSYISDNAVTLPLTLWEEWIDYFSEEIKLAHTCFKMCNLIVRQYGCEPLYLSTCSDIYCSVIPDDSIEINFDFPDEEQTEQNITISSIDLITEFEKTYQCRICRKHLPSSDLIVKIVVHVVNPLNCQRC